MAGDQRDEREARAEIQGAQVGDNNQQVNHFGPRQAARVGRDNYYAAGNMDIRIYEAPPAGTSLPDLAPPGSAPPIARLVRDWDPYELGLHRSGELPGADKPGKRSAMTPYVRRDLHDALRASLLEGGLHVILGDSATGKTRLGYEAARDAVPDWRLIRAYNQEELRKLEHVGLTNTVIWLENLEEFVGEEGLNPGRLNTLCARGTVAIIGTLRITAQEELVRAGGGSIPQGVMELLERGQDWSAGHQGVLGIEFSPQERVRASRLRDADARIARALDSAPGNRGPRYLAGARAAIQRWKEADSSKAHQTGAALIRAAVDFRRAGYFGPIPKYALLRAYPAYLPGSEAVSVDVLTRELDWACEPPAGLEPCLRITPDGMCRSFDALVDHAQRSHQGHNPIRPEVWELALELSLDAPDKTFQIGRNAVGYWERDLAIRACQQAAGFGHRDAMYLLGHLLRLAGKHGEAERVLTTAFEAGHPSAMLALARIYRDTDRLEEAKRVLTGGAQSGMPLAWHLLAGELEDRVPTEQAAAYRARSIAELDAKMGDGDAEAAYWLGNILEDYQPQRAEQAYRNAIKYGYEEAYYALADLLSSVDDIDGAIKVLRQAANRGKARAALSLGYLLSREFRVDEAIEAYRWAAELGDLGVNGNLGLTLMQQGKKQEAMEAWHAGAEAGYPGAAYWLGHFLLKDEPQEARRHFDTAKQGFRREMTFDNPVAFYHYGLICNDLGEIDEAIKAFQRAHELGYPGSQEWQTFTPTRNRVNISAKRRIEH
jgi:tetratricopeptide (TPR) repeat protein